MKFKDLAKYLLYFSSLALFSCTTKKDASTPTNLTPISAETKNISTNTTFQTHSFNTLQFKDLVPVSKKAHGVNEGGIFLVHNDPNQKVHVKELAFNKASYNSLILSYQMSRLLHLICPDQGPLIVPVLGAKIPMMASYDMPTFKKHENEKMERSILLHLALDLMDIFDRHEENLGVVFIKGKWLAAVVDIDMFSQFKQNWFLTFKEHYASENKEELFSALSVMASFSATTIKQAYDAGIFELDQDLLFKPIRKFVNVDFILSQVLNRKHQMEWVHKHFESYLESLKRKKSLDDILKPEDIADDTYGLFLEQSIIMNNSKMFYTLLSHGAKDLYGWALNVAAKNNNLEMVNALLSHGAKVQAESLVEAVYHNNFEMVNALLSRGANVLNEKTEAPIDYLLEVAAKNNNLEIVKVLLSHGANLDGLYDASKNNNLEMVNVLLSYGAKDPTGLALSAAVGNNNLEMVNVLISHGAEDPYGWALEKARANKNEQIIKILEKLHSSKKRPN